jgi:hypothetical protein
MHTKDRRARLCLRASVAYTGRTADFPMVGSAMTKNEVSIARGILYVAAVVGGIYGLIFLANPEWNFELSQDPGVPANPGWVRWAGGVLFGLALAAWLATAQPDRQRPLVVGLVAVYTLVFLSLLYSTLSGEYRGAQWFVWLPTLISLGLAAAMIWLLTKQR